MDILETIMNAQGGAAVQQLGSQLGLGPDQTASALNALLPALAAGLQKNAGSQGGLAGLAAALASGNHQQYIDNPGTLADPSTIEDGNGILGHLFGSKEVSRQVASRAAAQTGVSSDVLKRMLPLAAALMMGAMSRKTAQGANLGAAAGGGGLASMLGPLLDSNRDGSILDDVTGMLGRFLGR
jgi:hypothetical protein